MSQCYIKGIDHASIVVADTARALTFYRDLLGLEVDEARPDIGYPGAWLQAGAQQIHLLELPNPDKASGRPAHGGRDRHFALQVTNLNALVEKIEQAGIEVSMSKSGRKAAFCRDYDANAIEFIER